MIGDNESLCRYLINSNSFSRAQCRVKHQAFLPPNNLKLSVFRIDGLTENNIWEIGILHVVKPLSLSSPSPKILYGRADITTTDVQSVNLTVDPDDKPPRHANIVGWPTEKDKQKIIALELAAKATLKLNPNH